MQGSNAVRDQLVELFRHEMPIKIGLLRAQWGLSAEQLPDFQQITSGESPDNVLDSQGSTWVLVLNPRVLRTTMVDIDDAGRQVNMVRYACRVYLWTKALDWPTAVEARGNFAQAARMCLLEYQNLSATVRGDTGFRSYQDTYGEEFGEPFRLQQSGGRVWAGALLAIDVDAEETLAAGSTRVPIGQVESVTPTGYAVGPDEPMTGAPDGNP